MKITIQAHTVLLYKAKKKEIHRRIDVRKKIIQHFFESETALCLEMLKERKKIGVDGPDRKQSGRDQSTLDESSAQDREGFQGSVLYVKVKVGSFHCTKL